MTALLEPRGRLTTKQMQGGQVPSTGEAAFLVALHKATAFPLNMGTPGGSLKSLSHQAESMVKQKKKSPSERIWTEGGARARGPWQEPVRGAQ